MHHKPISDQGQLLPTDRREAMDISQINLLTGRGTMLCGASLEATGGCR